MYSILTLLSLEVKIIRMDLTYGHLIINFFVNYLCITEAARLTPVDKAILESMDQGQFEGFTYTNPHTTD